MATTQEAINNALNATGQDSVPPLPTSLSVFDSRIPQDVAIQKSLLALKGLGYTGTILPRVEKWSDYPNNQKDTRPPAQRPAGWSIHDGAEYPKVYVGDYSTDYRNATKGDANAVKTLAAVIAHEDFHNQHGTDEGPAYDKQLAILKALKASSSDVSRIEAVQRFITKAKK